MRRPLGNGVAKEHDLAQLRLVFLASNTYLIVTAELLRVSVSVDHHRQPHSTFLIRPHDVVGLLRGELADSTTNGGFDRCTRETKGVVQRLTGYVDRHASNREEEAACFSGDFSQSTLPLPPSHRVVEFVGDEV